MASTGTNTSGGQEATVTVAASDCIPKELADELARAIKVVFPNFSEGGVVNPLTTAALEQLSEQVINSDSFDTGLGEKVNTPDFLTRVVNLFAGSSQLTDVVTEQVDAKFEDKESLFEELYPVGSIYENATNPTNPGTLLGFGTWVTLGAGRVLIGVDGADSDFEEAELTGGSKSMTTITPIPITGYGTTGDKLGTAVEGSLISGSGIIEGVENLESLRQAGTTPDAESNEFNNLPPYLTVHRWVRTS